MNTPSTSSHPTSKTRRSGRIACWRQTCKLRFAPYLTVRLEAGRIVATCHGKAYPVSQEFLIELWSWA